LQISATIGAPTSTESWKVRELVQLVTGAAQLLQAAIVPLVPVAFGRQSLALLLRPLLLLLVAQLGGAPLLLAGLEIGVVLAPQAAHFGRLEPLGAHDCRQRVAALEGGEHRCGHVAGAAPLPAAVDDVVARARIGLHLIGIKARDAARVLDGVQRAVADEAPHPFARHPE
jgi:hypothetical protein